MNSNSEIQEEPSNESHMTELENSVLVGHRISIENLQGDNLLVGESETMILYNTF